VNGGGAREIEVATLRTASSTDKTFAHPPLSSSSLGGFFSAVPLAVEGRRRFLSLSTCVACFNLVSRVLLTLSRRAYKHLSVLDGRSLSQVTRV
jgi:hypothetical protein